MYFGLIKCFVALCANAHLYPFYFAKACVTAYIQALISATGWEKKGCCPLTGKQLNKEKLKYTQAPVSNPTSCTKSRNEWNKTQQGTQLTTKPNRKLQRYWIRVFSKFVSQPFFLCAQVASSYLMQVYAIQKQREGKERRMIVQGNG